MIDFEYDTFEETTEQFRSWLRQQGISDEIAWLCQEDFTCYKRKWWLHWPFPASNNILTERFFEHGVHQKLGFSIEALCEVEQKAICYIWVPQDEQSASYAMQTALRFKSHTDPPVPILVSNSFRWKFLKALNRLRSRNYLELDLPSKAGLSSLSN